MWLSKAAAVFLALLALGGCGFTPVYATPAAGSAPGMQDRLRDVEIGMIADRNGQYLRNAILDATGAANASPRYFLRIHQLDKEVVGFGIRKDASRTRGDVTLRAEMELIDMQTGAVVLRRSLHARGGYNRMDNLYGALVAEDDITDRLLDEMADRAVTEMTLFFSRQP
jgi:LPS-assembly lipoprotein